MTDVFEWLDRVCEWPVELAAFKSPHSRAWNKAGVRPGGFSRVRTRAT